MYKRIGIYEKEDFRIWLVQTNHNLFETRCYNPLDGNFRPKRINGSRQEAHNHMVNSGYKVVKE